LDLDYSNRSLIGYVLSVSPAPDSCGASAGDNKGGANIGGAGRGDDDRGAGTGVDATRPTMGGAGIGGVNAGRERCEDIPARVETVTANVPLGSDSIHASGAKTRLGNASRGNGLAPVPPGRGMLGLGGVQPQS
jgi:hypothetical protein